MQQDAGECLVGHRLAGGLSVLDGKIDGRIIQLKSIRSLGLLGIVVASLQGQKHFSILPSGHGIHQSVVADAADFKGDAGDGFRFICLIDFGKLHTAYRRIVEPEFLCIDRVDHHRLALGVGVDGVPRDAFHFSYYHCAGDAGKDDLALRIGPVQAIGGQLTALVWEIGAIRISDLELHPLQRGLVLAGQLMDDEVSHRLVAELYRDGLPFLDLYGLGRIVQQIAWLGTGFLDDQRGPGFYSFHQESAGAVCHELAVGITHHGAVRFCH